MKGMSLLEFPQNQAVDKMYVGNDFRNKIKKYFDYDSPNVVPELLTEHLIVQCGILHTLQICASNFC